PKSFESDDGLVVLPPARGPHATPAVDPPAVDVAQVLADELVDGAVVQRRLSRAACVVVPLDGLGVNAVVLEVFFGPVAPDASPAPTVASIAAASAASRGLGLWIVSSDRAFDVAGVGTAHPRLGAEECGPGARGHHHRPPVGQGSEVGDVQDPLAVELLGHGALPATVGRGGREAVIVADHP